MLKYVDTDIVFQELPDEVTLAVNLSGCPCRCPGCHSKHLWEDGGRPFDEAAVEQMLSQHVDEITCISIMGGDAEPHEVNLIAASLRKHHPNLHIAWWSGRTLLSSDVNPDNFDYIKLGPYLRHLGPLRSPTTNQRLYHIEGGKFRDITSYFQRRSLASA